MTIVESPAPELLFRLEPASYDPMTMRRLLHEGGIKTTVQFRYSLMSLPVLVLERPVDIMLISLKSLPQIFEEDIEAEEGHGEVSDYGANLIESHEKWFMEVKKVLGLDICPPIIAPLVALHPSHSKLKAFLKPTHREDQIIFAMDAVASIEGDDDPLVYSLKFGRRDQKTHLCTEPYTGSDYSYVAEYQWIFLRYV